MEFSDKIENEDTIKVNDSGSFDTECSAKVEFSFNPKNNDVFIRCAGYFFGERDLITLKNFCDYAISELETED